MSNKYYSIKTYPISVTSINKNDEFYGFIHADDTDKLKHKIKIFRKKGLIAFGSIFRVRVLEEYSTFAKGKSDIQEHHSLLNPAIAINTQLIAM